MARRDSIFVIRGAKRTKFSLKTYHFPRLKPYIKIPEMHKSIKEQQKLNGYTPESTTLRATRPAYIEPF